MAFAIKAAIDEPRAKTFALSAQKTMYGGKHIARGDTVFLFASQNDGGQGLIARGVVTSVEAVPGKRGIERQTPRQRDHQTHRARQVAARAERAQALQRLE